MSITGAVMRGRRMAEQLMIDACTIRRPTGEATGPGGVITPTYDPPYYAGKCRVQVRSPNAASADVGEAYVLVSRIEIQLPVVAGTADIREGDEVAMTASVLDPSLVGRTYVVRDVLGKSHLTSRRLGVLEVTS